MKKTHIVALMMIGVLIAVIMTLSSSYTTYESFATAYSESGKEYQVIGTLVRADEMHYEPEVDPNYFSFYMADRDSDIKKVIFKEAKPRDFERSDQIVTVGKMVGDEFHASKMLLKCPSKYKDSDPNIKMSENVGILN